MKCETFPVHVRSMKASASMKIVCRESEDVAGVVLREYTLHFPAGGTEGPVLLEWVIPLLDIAGKWHSAIGFDRSLTSEWTQYLESYATLNAPVISLFSARGENRLTFAVSDGLNPVKMQAQVEEDVAGVRCRVLLLDFPVGDLDLYRVTLRLDLRAHSYQEALADVAAWWAAMEAYRPAPVPDGALLPVYSTWYGFHQVLSEKEIEEECRWAKSMGFGTVIVDDGWQCDDQNKGYDFCGDWEVAESKFPGFPAHVARVRAMGLKYMLWFSVPFVGVKSRMWRDLGAYVLEKPGRNAPCLDPRFPKVREYLLTCFRRAVTEWGLEGLKLDFVDQFTAEKPGSAPGDPPDYSSVPLAADRLFRDLADSLPPECLIEFRQKYTGPAMRKYGNMLRANDCPGDALSNRVRTLDLRLLSGNTAVHSDMVMWHRDERPERVAIQLWSTLFSVPQVSVRRGAITPEQEAVLRFYLDFWTRHRDLLLGASLEAKHPQELYPEVRASDGSREVVVAYADRVLVLGELSSLRRCIVVNASEHPRLVLDVQTRVCRHHSRRFLCTGREEPAGLPEILSGLLEVRLPPGSLLSIDFPD